MTPLDMLTAARRIIEYAHNHNDQSFLSNHRDQDAILRQLTIIGEAAKRISAELRGAHPGIPWRRIAGFRDVVVHDYFHVDLDEVWRIVQNDVPDLVKLITPLVPPP